MALQLPGRPQIYQADPFEEFRKSYDHTKGIVDERNGNEAFGKYADTLYGGQPSPQAPVSEQPAKGLDFLRNLLTGQNPEAPTVPAAAVAPQRTPGDATPNGDLSGYFSSIRSAESGGNDAAKNPNSSATGRYQFTSGTWNDLMRNQPDLGLTADGRTDPQQQERAIRAFTAGNAKALSSSGIPVNPGNLYAAHFLGAGGASDVLRGQDNAPVSAYVGPEVVNANPFLRDMTVADFKAWSAQKGGGQGGGYSAPQGDGGGVEGIPQATGPKYTLPPREVMQALFKSPDTRQIAISLAQGAQQGQNATTLQTFNRPDGSIWQFNPATGEIDVVQDALDRQAKQAQIDSTGVPTGYRRATGGGLEYIPNGPADPANPLNAAKTDSFTTLRPEEVKSLGLPPGSYQRSSDGKVSQIGGGGTNVTVNNGGEGPDGALSKALSEAEGKEWSGYKSAAAVSGSNAQDFQVLGELMTLAPQGPIQGRLADTFKGFNSAGDAAKSIIKRIAPTLRAPGSGATSDIEYQGMLESLPSLINQPEANAAILAIMQAKAQLNIDRGKIVTAYQLGKDKGGMSPAEARAAMDELNSRSIITPDMRRALIGLGGDGSAAPAQAAPPAAGEIVDGYRFKGGNPADQANWEQVM